MRGVEKGVMASDVLFCGLRLTYVEFVLSCIAIAANMVTKDDGLLSKVQLAPNHAYVR